ncbi:MAG: PAS domain S-box protein [Desulfovibrio sp.]|nr:PAS domain S-box protein [Desulfovibrio sp.]
MMSPEMSEARKQVRLLDAMPVSVVITGAEDNIIRYANEEVANLLEISPESMVGAHAPDFYVDPEDRRVMVSQLERQGRLSAHEVRLRKGTGGEVYCLISAVPISHHKSSCYLFTLLDISARKAFEWEIDKLSQALQHSPIAVLMYDEDGVVEYVNKAFVALTGYEAEEVLGRGLDVISSRQQDEAVSRKMWKTLRQGHVWRGETQHRNKSGREFWSMTHVAPLDEGKQAGARHFVSFMEDITKRKVAEGVLQERLQFIQTLMDAVPTPIFYKNIDGVYQGCNRAFEEYFGIIRPLLIGRTLHEMQPELDAGAFHERDIQLARRGGMEVYESHARRKDGEIRDVIFHKAAYRNASGTPVGIVGSVTDITERKRAEREARENESTLTHVLQGIRAGIMVVNPEGGTIEDVNDRVVEMLGRERSECRSSSCDSLHWLDEFGVPVASGTLLKPQTDKEYRLSLAGGGVLPVALTVLPTTIRGEPRILQILFDLSERKALERQLNLAQKLESVGQLAAGIAHEINTPIQYVGSNLTYMQEALARLAQAMEQCEQCTEVSGELKEELLEEIPDAIKDAQEGVGRVASIVQAMRTFSHPGSDEQVPLDVNDAIRSTVTIARNEWKYHSDVVLELDDTLPDLYCVPGDFNQVVLNVLVNAAHAVADKVGSSGEKGEIHVSTAREGDNVVIRIADTGGGIPEEHKDHIFDPFFTTKTVGRGTGQGLAITHAIVDRHHGDIDFSSIPGKGTTFVIRLPLEGAQS